MLQRRASPAGLELQETLRASTNARGGWGYYPGKSSRLEPTCWALLALAAGGAAAADLETHARFLASCQQPSGWLLEDPKLPANVGFNALASFTGFALPQTSSDAIRRRLFDALVGMKGIQAANELHSGQNNTLQGWPWIDTTFSWVEPTSWGVIALKTARRAGMQSAAADARIGEAERLLIDRACRDGGWNFGNAIVLNQDLRPYVPTTALALLALQDRLNEPVVERGVAFLDAHWQDEISATATGLSLICLHVFGRPVDRLDARLREHAERALAFGNLHGIALALVALSVREKTNAFRL